MNFPKRVWVNGRLVDPAEPAISVFDRGFLYGDGIYETVRVYDGKIFRFDQHYQRLESSARAVKLALDRTKSAVRAGAEAVLRANKLKEATVRLTVTRGPGPLGFDPSHSRMPTWVLTAVPVTVHAPQLYERGIRAALARVRRNSRSSLDPAAKTTNNLNNILAKMQAMERKAYEALMLNTDGYLAEGTICNIFFVSGNVLKTPALECGLLAGVTRAAVLELARARKLPVVEGRYRPRDLFGAKEVFLTSTTFEVLPVTTVVDEDGQVRTIGGGRPGPWAPLLRQDYRRLAAKETGARL